MDNKDVCKIRFDFMAHLHKMMARQSEEFEFEKEDIGEEYVCSMVKPLHDLLNKPLGDLKKKLRNQCRTYLTFIYRKITLTSHHKI